MIKKLSELDIGNIICDMHDGFSTKNIEGVLISYGLTAINAPDGSQFIYKILNGNGYQNTFYTNKSLIVIDSPYEENSGEWVVKAAYSYDNKFFGLVTIRMRPNV